VTVAEAAAALGAGALAIVPTDTVYGLAARPEGAAAIFDVKRRPRAKALPVLGASIEQLRAVAVLEGGASALAARAWPGALTLVVRRAAGFTADLGGRDDGTVAVRVPDHPVALELLRSTGPLAVTSANVSGEPPATTAAAACALAPGAVCLDGGTCDGAPSTVVKLVGDGAGGDVQVLRQGALPAEQVLAWFRSPSTGS
jgi:L-threonylcarbamoyladenylate synthase